MLRTRLILWPVLAALFLLLLAYIGDALEALKDCL
jgi:hypothetical protein